MKELFIWLISCFIYFSLFSQTGIDTSLFQQVLNTDYKSSKSNTEKLKTFYSIKTQIERSDLRNDSTYVLVLIKISKYETLVNDNYTLSISFANKALNVVNRQKVSLKPLIINSYYNIASSYQNLMLYKQALKYYDSAIMLCDNKFNDTKNFQLEARLFKADIYRLLGDYKKIIDECNKGINASIVKKDSLHFVYFLNRKAQALSYIGLLNQAYVNATLAIPIAKQLNEQFELSISYKVLGFIYEKENIIDSAEFFFKQSILLRNKTQDYQQTVNDYIDLGNLYLNDLQDYKKAEQCYRQALFYSNKIESPLDRSLRAALSNLNLGETFLIQQQFKQASDFFIQSFDDLQINLHHNIKENAVSNQISSIANKDLIINLMNDKTNLLLQQYKFNNDKSFLTACLQTAIITDSVTTQIRHEQLGEESKLYWRDKTRDFYTNVIEASYLAKRPDLAFFFMEKSRSVLLNDRLNELDAVSYLSKTDAAKQEAYQIKIIELEQKLSSLNQTSKEFQNIQLQLIDAQNELDKYAKSLETKYPAYYQYKYADDVPSLKNLQSYLAKNNQSFVHYFLGDTVTYILAITPTSTKFIRLSSKIFRNEQLSLFLQLCCKQRSAYE